MCKKIKNCGSIYILLFFSLVLVSTSYAVQCIEEADESEIDSEWEADLPAPENIDIVQHKNGLSLSWDAVSEGCEYTIYWSKDPNVTKNRFDGKIDGITETEFIHTQEAPDTPLDPGTTYYYVVTTEATRGESSASDEVQEMVAYSSISEAQKKNLSLKTRWPPEPKPSDRTREEMERMERLLRSIRFSHRIPIIDLLLLN